MDNGKGDLENFTDWKERFEMVAEAYHWDKRTKLVNLVTRLCGQAYSFFMSLPNVSSDVTIWWELQKRSGLCPVHDTDGAVIREYGYLMIIGIVPSKLSQLP